MLQFARHPATVGVGDGWRMAIRFVAGTWRVWLPLSLAMGFLWAAADAAGLRLTPEPGVINMVPSVIPYEILGDILGAVAAVLIGAMAIAALRGRPFTMAWFRSVAPTAFAVQLISLIPSTVSTLTQSSEAIMTGPLIVVVLVVMIVVLYIALRLSFWQQTIFDGAPFADGFDAAWRISRDGVLRILGWGVAFGMPVIVAYWLLGLALAGISAEPVRVGVTEFVTTAWLPIFAGSNAVLYESQRYRRGEVAVAPSPAVVEPTAGALP